MEDTGTAIAREPQTRSKTSKRPEGKTAHEVEQIRMGNVTIQAPAALIKLSGQYREDCGNIRADKVEANALRAAQEAYVSALNGAFEQDEEFQYALLERESRKK